MIQITPKRKRLLLKILPYPFIFLVGGLIYVNVEFGLLGASKNYPLSETVYDPVNSMITIIFMNSILGLALGVIEELAFKNGFKQVGFTLKIVLKTLLYMMIFVMMLVIFSLLLNALNNGMSVTDSAVYEPVFTFLMSYGVISIVVYAGSIIGLSLFFSDIVDYLGLDVVGNFFSGKYSKPVYENRIFMFLDMKDSTAIAERIGHKKHYELINEYYGDMTDAIVQTHGSIYQYVGDEIVLSWKLEDGLKHSQCLQCFFLIESSIAQKSEHYISKYGVVPGFKAGIHSGEVTRGQVGQIKRDLLYTGDVLNATARIQGMCNNLNTRFLISDHLKRLLPKNDLKFKSMGEFELRGRQRKEKLYSLDSFGGV